MEFIIFSVIIYLCAFYLIYKIPHNFQERQYLYQKLDKLELEIKNIPKFKEQLFLICNESYEGLASDKKKEILTEYARILDNYYLEIANACELTMELNLKKPSIFLYNLVKTLLVVKTLLKENPPKKYYHILNEKLVALGEKELPNCAIKDCEKIMKSFDIKYNKS